MSQAIPEFLQYGATGILALGFLVLLVLFVRADKRAEKYAESLKETSFDRSQLIRVVSDNTRAITSMISQIETLNTNHGRTGGIMDRLERRIESGKCPFGERP